MNYSKNMIVQLDKDWITDFIFDFSKDLKEISTFAVDATVGISASNSVVTDLNKIAVRISGGTLNTKYPVTVSATAPNGEKRDMTVIFLTQ